MTDFELTKSCFRLPQGMIYLDGNSLGPLPVSTSERVAQTIDREWGEMVITGWNRAGWMAQPTALADRIGRLIGADPGTMVLGDTLSVKVYQALAAALDVADGNRRVILSDSGNFPSDLYMAQGLLDSLGTGLELRVVAPNEVEAHLTKDVAVLMLTEVDYRTGRKHDMHGLSRLAMNQGVVTIWDLAHSAGALPVDVAKCGVDFAIGCTYKYLNAGPGAPAFIYVRPDLIDKVAPALCGWLGHDAPFEFEASYRPASGIERMRVGTPPVLQLAALEASLDIWDRVDMAEVRAQSIRLSEAFIKGVTSRCPDLQLASPADPMMRGSQVSFHFEFGYAAMQACIARGLVGDFRAPDIMRFGITPLFIGDEEIAAAIDILSEVITDRLWDRPEYHAKSLVT